MKLLGVDLAQSFWYGPLGDFNPRGVAWIPVITPWLFDQYKLKHDPKETQYVKFSDGAFIFSNSELPISVDLAVYPGGLTAITRYSTDASEAFLVELFVKLSKEFSISPPTEIIRDKKFFSQLWVSTDKSLEILNPKLKKIAAFLSDNSGGIKFEFGGMSFWADQTLKFPPQAFVLERAAGIPFSENRYFSRAQLETDRHLQLLNQIEKIIS